MISSADSWDIAGSDAATAMASKLMEPIRDALRRTRASIMVM
jgi:hypothetical protein